jgi:hypothetical protein
METLMYPKEVKARKQHYCSFCGEKIVIDEKYMKSTHIYDGQVYDWKAHKYCFKLAHTLNMYSECDEGVTMDFFMESVSEKHSDILFKQLPEKGCEDIKRQLLCVRFRDKLWFVIRHFNKPENKS